MNTITEQDDNDDLIPVETPPAEEAPVAEEQDASDEHDDEHDDDERLAQSEDDSDEDISSSSNREKRRKRRDMQRRAREAKDRELAMLRETVAQLSQRVSATESRAVTSDAQALQNQYAKAVREMQQAETIMAKAIEAGNGEDAAAALRIRDQAKAEAESLQARYVQHQEAMQQASSPKVAPEVINYAKQWMEANPWYDPQARDRDSALTKAIDNELAREGFDPRSREYWEELTDRVAEALGSNDQQGGKAATTPRRKAPPTGNTREHAPTSTRKEIYVTPERKQAMVEAGIWDDPVRRQKQLKAYQEYDRNAAR